MTYTAYLNDILIYSEDKLQYKTYIKQVIKRLQAVGLQDDIKKCKFNIKRTKYVGFIISIERI